MRPDIHGPAEFADRVEEDRLALMALCLESKAGHVAGGESAAASRRRKE